MDEETLRGAAAAIPKVQCMHCRNGGNRVEAWICNSCVPHRETGNADSGARDAAWVM